MRKYKIIITGGHFTCAAAVIDELIHKNYEVIYVGRKYAQEEDKTESAEFLSIIKDYPQVRLLLITTGKLQRFINLASILSFVKIPIGIVQSIIWILKIKPDLILSFGGYVALPVVIAAFLFRVRVVTHEQTRSMGLSNKIISLFAYKVCLSWTGQNKISSKFLITGLPLRKSIKKVIKKLPLIINKPLIYITGGSLGSHSINQLIYPIIKRLLRDFSIIHQCGNNNKYQDYKKFINLKKSLTTELNQRYLPVKYIDPEYLGFVYKSSSVVVGRSGANTVYELSYYGLPAIFIPIPFSANDEQLINAQFYTKSQAGIILKQENIDSNILFNKIIEFHRNLNRYKRNSGRLRSLIITRGTQNLIKVIEDSLSI